MKVLFVNTSDNTGGAAIAATRLLNALNKAGVQTQMVVACKTSTHPQVTAVQNKWQKTFNFLWERVVVWIENLLSKKNLFTVSIANTGKDITQTKAFKEADIIHLHWINQGMLSLDNIQKIIHSGKPVVWTMHDMWACTGICHYAHSCEAFQTSCHHCPFLRFPKSRDLSYRIFKKKKDLFQQANLHIVTVSHWLANLTQSSTLLGHQPIDVIPNTISLDEFQLLSRKESRQSLQLNEDQLVILFGAARVDDPIKGFDILLKAIQYLIDNRGIDKDKLHLITFGAIKHPENVIPHIPVTHTDMGWITDKTMMSILYSAANISVSTSLYETFGQTLIEAQACGCLPISFGNSGQSDIITHKTNGFLADYLSIESVADGIIWGWTRSQTIDRESLRNEVVRKYSGNTVSKQYIKLYQQLLDIR